MIHLKIKKLRIFSKDRTLRTKLTFWLLTVSLVPLITAAYFTYTNTNRIVKEQSIKNVNEITKKKVNEITEYFNEKINDVKAIENIPGLSKYFNYEALNSNNHTSQYSATSKKINTFLKRLRPIYDFRDIMLVSPTGKILYSSNYKKDVGHNLGAEEFNKPELLKSFKKVINSKIMRVSKIFYSSADDKFSEFILTPILEKGKIKGIIAVELNARKLLSVINDSTGLGKTGETILAEKQNNKAVFVVPTRSNPEAAFNYSVVIGSKDGIPIQLAVAGKSGMGLSVDYRNKKIIASWKYIPALNLGLVVKINQDEAFAPMSVIKNWIIFVILLIAFLVIVTIFIISKSISKPIADLTKVSRAIAEGDFSKRIDRNVEGEIKMLAEAFSLMQQNLQDAISKKDKEITERKHTEKLLLESKTKFETLFEQSTYAIFLMKKNHFIECNLKVAEMFLCSKKDILNSSPVNLSPATQPNGESSEKFIQHYISAASKSGPQFFEWQHKKFDGTLFDAEVNLKAIQLPEGEIIFAQVKDVTERKLADAELKKLSLAVEQAAVSILISDTDGNIEYVNDKYTEVTGYTLGEISGKKASILKSGKTKISVYENLWDTITSNKQWKGNLLNKKKNGELYWESNNITPITDSKGNITHYLAVKEDITEREKLRNELIENENKFRNVTETAPYAIITTDVNGIITSWNFAAKNMFGLLQSEALNTSILKLIPIQFRKNYEKAITNKKHFNNLNLVSNTTELIGLTSVGKEFPIEISLSKWRAYDQTYFTAHIKDITERKLYESALKDSEEKYKTFFMNDLTADILSSVNGKVLDYNPAFCRLIGSNPKVNLKGYDASDFYVRKSKRTELLRQLEKERKLENYETQIKRIDGTVIDIIENVVGEFNDNGDLMFVRAYILDITKRKQTEKEIRHYQEHLEDIVEERTRELEISETKFRTLAQNSNDTIMRFDKNFRHLYVNPVVTKQTGIEMERFIGKTHEELGFPKNLCTLWEEAIQKVFSTKSKNHIEFELPNNIWVDWELVPEFSNLNEVSTVITFGRDITERKVAEKTIAAALKRERELSKIKSLFLSSASHEFKTPLTTILSSVGLLETFRKRGNMEKYSKHISKIEDSVKYLRTMIEEILTLQKEDTGQLTYNPKKTDLFNLTESIFAEMGNAALNEHICKLNYNINKDEFFLIDKKLIKLILSNLISNSIKYSPKGGNIIVDVTQINKNIVLKIKDEGIGISEKNEDKIYTQFYRGVNYDDIQGTGLGLSIVKKSVELHGGSIKYKSQVNKGTIFTVTIPINKEKD